MKVSLVILLATVWLSFSHCAILNNQQELSTKICILTTLLTKDCPSYQKVSNSSGTNEQELRVTYERLKQELTDCHIGRHQSAGELMVLLPYHIIIYRRRF